MEIQTALLRGAFTTAAVRKYRKGSCGSRDSCGGGEIQKKAPSGVDTTAAVGKYRESSCGSGHCCGSGEKQLGDGGGGWRRRGCYGVSEVYSKVDRRLGSGGLP